jgi:hypothetical protein
MAKLYEYANTGDDDQAYSLAYGVNWLGTVFTTGSVKHSVTSVKLKLYRAGSPGTLAVSIRATTGATPLPTGGDLTSGTTNANTLPTGSPYEWREIALTEYALLPNTTYAIAIRATSGDSANYVAWRYKTLGTTGSFRYSSDSGATWNVGNANHMFEIWGSTEYFDPTDSGAGTEVITILDAEFINVSDSGVGTDVATVAEWVAVIDTGLGTDIIYLLGELLIDGLSLDHALRVRVSEATIVASKPVSSGLPTRLYLGGQGRALEIEGWVATIAELNTIEALADGAVHEIQLPTGSRVSVHIPDVNPVRPIEPGKYPYTIRAVERMD